MISLRSVAPLALALTLAAAPAGRSVDTVVLVVRHAEKAGATGDVPLSPAGEERARALVSTARDAGVSAIITTPFQRTRQTAAPLATALGITPEVVGISGTTADHARAVAEAIRTRHAGRTVLVVGHSNTVAPIVGALGGPGLPDLCDEQYDALFTVVITDGKSRVVQSRYGAPSELTVTCGAMRR